MTRPRLDPSMVQAFRETTLCLIGLYRVYEVDSDLKHATAVALQRVFRRYLRAIAGIGNRSHQSVLHALADELDRFKIETP